MTRLPEALSGPSYLEAAAKTSLSALPPDTVVPSAFLRLYCGWTEEDVRSLAPADEMANRFGPIGRKSVKGYVLADALRAERKRDFMARHAVPLMMSETRLKGEYFFTDRLMAKWLGEPDALVDNPHYKSAAPMRLHRIGKILLLRRVEEAERDLADVADKRLARSESARLAARTRAQQWITRFETVKVRYYFTGMSLRQVEDQARQRRGMRAKEWEDTDILTRHRWMVNTLRHEQTDYDQILAFDLPPGRAGAECYRTLKRRILNRIGAEFPQLANEAAAQA